jgi:hypothetical protein
MNEITPDVYRQLKLQAHIEGRSGQHVGGDSHVQASGSVKTSGGQQTSGCENNRQ